MLLSPVPQFAGGDKNLEDIEVSLAEDEKSKEQGEEWQKLLAEANRLKNRRLQASSEVPSEEPQALKASEKSKKEQLSPAEEKQMLILNLSLITFWKKEKIS